jgi:hypothetical protein
MSYKIGSVKANRLKKQDGSTALIDASNVFQGTLTEGAVTAHEAALDLEQLNIDATLDMGSQKITTTATPSLSADLVTKGYSDSNYATTSVVSSLSSTVSSLNSTVSSNSSGISTNSSGISTNSSGISTNTSSISTNTSAISSLTTGMHWQNNAISFLTTVPASPTAGDRYVITAGTHINKIATRGASSWAYVVPLDGYAIVAQDDGAVTGYDEGMYFYDAETTTWIKLASTAALSGKLAAASNLSDLGNAATARTNLGVDAAGTDNSSDVTLAAVSGRYLTLSGQEITCSTVPVALGGTGSTTAAMVGLITAADAAASRSVLGVDAAGTDNSTAATLAAVSSNYLSISGQAITAGTIPVALGGTGATSASAARTALGVPSTSDISGMLTSSSAASSLSDVSYSSPTSGQALVWSGSAWANSTISAGALDSLSDVYAASPSSGQVLRNSGSSWQNSYVQMDDLGNVDASSPASGQMLLWNGSSNKWEPGMPAMQDLHKTHSDLTSNAMTLIAANMVHYAEFDMGSNAANVTITLPALSSMGTSSQETKMKFVSMPNSGAGTITVQCAGADLLDGQTSLVIDEAYAGFSLIFSIDGSTVKGWRIA